jgi:hypothetical protein
MSDSRGKTGARLAGKHLLGFRSKTTGGEDPGSLRVSSAKIGFETTRPPPPKTDSNNSDKK